MAHKSLLGLVVLGVGVTLLAGCSAADETSEPALAASSPFSTAPGEPNHEEITSVALSFLKPEVLAALIAADVATDAVFALNNANHFDDCNFTGGSEVIVMNEAQAVGHLGPDVPIGEGDALALVHFGRALHAAQDFYAHSNWVELGGAVLVDASLTEFPRLSPYSVIPSTGFVVVEGRKPKHSALVRRDETPYPESAVVTVRNRGSVALGLISGTVDYEPGNECPNSVAMTHEELNKDKSSNAGRVAQYEAARSLAIAQTRHEWCRLSALAGQAHGEAGLLRLATWVSEGAAQPDCTTE